MKIELSKREIELLMTSLEDHLDSVRKYNKKESMETNDLYHKLNKKMGE